MKNIKNIKFKNQTRPNSSFDFLDLKELLSRDLDHQITDLHKLEFFNLLIVTQGQGYHTIDFTDYKYSKRTLFTIRKDQVHKFFHSPSAKGYLLIFTEDFLASHYDKVEVHKSFQVFNDFLASPKLEMKEQEFKELEALISIIKVEYLERGDEFSMSIIRSALHILLNKLFRAKNRNGNTSIDKKYLEEFLSFQKLVEDKCFKTKKVLDYAKIMACTSKTLNNVCRAIVDKSAKTVIDEIVIIQLKRLLINTSLSITEIAYTAGFHEPSNMYKYFKKYTNSSPESFRKAYA